MATVAEVVLLHVEDGVGWIRLNQPEKLNPLGAAVREPLDSAFKRFERDPEVRVVVLIGSGRAFSAGADVREFPGRSAREIADGLREFWLPLFQRIRTMPKPVICGLNGLAAGIGVSLAVACDIRIAADDAYFSEAFVNIGLGPDGGISWTLPRYVGRGKALEMFYTGLPLPAAEAEGYGLVNRVVARNEVEPECRMLALQLAAASPGALAAAKRAVEFAETAGFAEAAEFESYLQEARADAEDFKEGVDAFLNKRKPEFRGR